MIRLMIILKSIKPLKNLVQKFYKLSMKYKFLIIAFLLATNLYAQKEACHYPFPNHTKYHDGVILPQVDRKVMDDSTRSFFIQWKDAYINYKNYDKEECAYVYSKGNTTGINEDNECVSEGMGYGMTIVALMTDNYNSEENKKLYNKLFRFYKKHPSKRDRDGFRKKDESLLMAYTVNGIQTNKEISKKSAASDGDIDIAFSLLLANAQWGSNQEINYLKEADTLIKIIYKQDINQYTKTILTSNKNEDDNNIRHALKQQYYDIRTSDFMPSELKIFDSVFKLQNFKSIVDSNYKYFFLVQDSVHNKTSLVPDYVLHIGYNIQQQGYSIIIPKKFYQETNNDGKYYYNACRVPWRIASDYIISGDFRAKAFVQPINRWISSQCNNDPHKVNAGYNLDGTEIMTDGEKDTLMMSFICPFAVSAMVDEKNQLWLNNLWDCIVKLPFLSNKKDLEYGYFENTIKMLNMIILSGNYWSRVTNK